MKKSPPMFKYPDLDYTPVQIAQNSQEITPDTKVYVGALNPQVFRSGIDHIYTSFPDGKLSRYNIEIGGKTKEYYLSALTEKNMIKTNIQQLLESPGFTILPSRERIDLVCLTVAQLGFPHGATTDEIYARREEWGLDLCPTETGPALRLATSNPDFMIIGMKQITNDDGYPKVFLLGKSGRGLWLRASIALPSEKWSENFPFVFSVRKLET
jgi:hypothetical protein